MSEEEKFEHITERISNMTQSPELSRLCSSGAEYLGDGAYIAQGSYPGELILFTADGVNVTNRVHLGPCEIAMLEEFMEKSKKP
jgi:hypothetical protein